MDWSGRNSGEEMKGRQVNKKDEKEERRRGGKHPIEQDSQHDESERNSREAEETLPAHLASLAPPNGRK